MEWLPFTLGLLILMGMPFPIGMTLIRRMSGHPRRIRRDVLAVLGFSLTATIVFAVWREAELRNDFVVVLVALGTGSLWAPLDIWLLTRRWWVAAAPVPFALGSAAVFRVIEAGTHGPWYIQSEGVALLVSIGAAAAAWHAATLGTLLVWLVPIRRGWKRARAGRCIACGYHLRGLSSGACPECGRSTVPRRGRTARP